MEGEQACAEGCDVVAFGPGYPRDSECLQLQVHLRFSHAAVSSCLRGIETRLGLIISAQRLETDSEVMGTRRIRPGIIESLGWRHK